MDILNIIVEYQTLIGTLIGSFLAIISSIFLWSLKEWYDNIKKMKDNQKEIENIFNMATRESEDAFKDVQMYITKAREALNKEKKIIISIPPKFNRIYLNEERLFFIKNNLDFLTSQQIDIAVSSAKKFNGYLDQFESMPVFLFDSMTKEIETGIFTQEEALKNYRSDQIRDLDRVEKLLNGGMLIVQRHLFRPIVVQSKKYRKIPKYVDVDKQLDFEADIVLAAMKKDLE